MASSLDNEDDSLIVILGTSPGASMNAEKCNGIANGELERSQIEDAMKSLSNEANMAFKAQFNLGDSPSPASMMVASTIITEDRSTEELQKRFGDLLDENFVLKETLKQNNDSMKEQFILIASCQEDMLKTHRLHQEKFDETRELVERLRQENKQLKLDITRLAEGEQASEQKKLSGFELVNSAEEDTIQKLSAQLELVEKQRRQLIVENEKLSWQKESLEHIVDSMNNERDDARRKLHSVELQLSTRENDHAQEVSKLHCVISDLQNSIKVQSSNIPPEEVSKRDAYIQQLESKMASLQNELKKSQIKILDLENIKLEFSQYKSSVSDMVRTHKEQIQELNNRIKEVQTTVFQPARVSSSPSGPTDNVRLYDRTLKHLADYLNSLTDGLADSLALALGAAAGALEARAERPGAERPGAERQRAALAALKDAIQTMHSHVVSNVGQVKGTLSIFEGIFKDHNELLKKTLTQTNTVARPALQRECGEGVQQLTAALLARGQQLSALQRELLEARAASDHAQLLQAQLDLYKSDFEAERESREKMASEKENLHSDLRIAQRKIQDMTTQLEELRVLSPSLHKSITSSRPRTVTKPYATTTTAITTATTTTVPAASNAVRKKKKIEKVGGKEDTPRESSPPPVRYVCPACDASFKTLLLLQRHVDECVL